MHCPSSWPFWPSEKLAKRHFQWIMFFILLKLEFFSNEANLLRNTVQRVFFCGCKILKIYGICHTCWTKHVFLQLVLNVPIEGIIFLSFSFLAQTSTVRSSSISQILEDEHNSVRKLISHKAVRTTAQGVICLSSPHKFRLCIKDLNILFFWKDFLH